MFDASDEELRDLQSKLAARQREAAAAQAALERAQVLGTLRPGSCNSVLGRDLRSLGFSSSILLLCRPFK